ncbi:hypothetical protein V6U90_27670 [Micromonospora sp. CPCC 206060]
MVNDTTRLLSLDGLAVERVELDPDGFPVVDLRTADEQHDAAQTAVCGHRGSRNG